MPTLTDLPSEVLWKIFRHLDKASAIRVGSTCSWLAETIFALNVPIQDYKTIRATQRAFDKLPFCTKSLEEGGCKCHSSDEIHNEVRFNHKSCVDGLVASEFYYVFKKLFHPSRPGITRDRMIKMAKREVVWLWSRDNFNTQFSETAMHHLLDRGFSPITSGKGTTRAVYERTRSHRYVGMLPSYPHSVRKRLLKDHILPGGVCSMTHNIPIPRVALTIVKAIRYEIMMRFVRDVCIYTPNGGNLCAEISLPTHDRSAWGFYYDDNFIFERYSSQSSGPSLLKKRVQRNLSPTVEKYSYTSDLKKTRRRN